MKRLAMAMMAALAMATAMGCASCSKTPTEGPTATTTGTTSSSTTTTGTGGAGGSGGEATGGGGTAGAGGAAEMAIGLEACAGKATLIAPLQGELNDPLGNPINEDGALAIERFIPPVYPFTFTRFRYVQGLGGPCTKTDHSAVYFVGPATGDLPTVWPGAIEIPVKASILEWDGKTAVVDITFPLPITVYAGEALIGAAKHTAAKVARACFMACDGGGPDPHAFYSRTNLMGAVDPCPATVCDTALLSVSPNPAAAAQYGNNDRSFLMAAYGHP